MAIKTTPPRPAHWIIELAGGLERQLVGPPETTNFHAAGWQVMFMTSTMTNARASTPRALSRPACYKTFTRSAWARASSS